VPGTGGPRSWLIALLATVIVVITGTILSLQPVVRSPIDIVTWRPLTLVATAVGIGIAVAVSALTLLALKRGLGVLARPRLPLAA
jgi:hypothetical protein